MITLCMMVKNEEKRLRESLESARPLADEIIVVDTGSTDGTIELARSLGAQVLTFPMGEDFSAGRNYALEHTHGEWVIFLDADEEIDSSSYHEIQRITTADELRAIQFISYTYLPGGSWVQLTPVRMFRHVPGVVRYQEPVFESVVQSVSSHGGRVTPSTIVIHHSGYFDWRKRQEKVRRYATIGTEMLTRSEYTSNTLFHFFLAIEWNEIGEFDRGPAVVARALAIPGDFPEHDRFLGLFYHTRGEYERALAHYDAQIKHGRPSVMAYNKSGIILCAVGRYEEAKTRFQKAVALNPHYAQHQLNLAWTLLKLGDEGAAREAFTLAIAKNPRVATTCFDPSLLPAPYLHFPDIVQESSLLNSLHI